MTPLPVPILIFFGVALFGLLLWLSLVDLKTYRIPNALNFPLILIGLLSGGFTVGFLNAAIGCVIGYLFMVAIEIGFKKFRGIDGLGRGDAKLLAAGGAWCGWMGLPYILLISSLFGLIAALMPAFRKNKQGWIAFGPFLALGIYIVWVSQRLAGA